MVAEMASNATARQSAVNPDGLQAPRQRHENLPLQRRQGLRQDTHAQGYLFVCAVVGGGEHGGATMEQRRPAAGNHAAALHRRALCTLAQPRCVAESRLVL